MVPVQAENSAGTPCFAYLYVNPVHASGDIAGGGYCGRDARFGTGTGLNDAGYGTVSVARHADYFVDVPGVDAYRSSAPDYDELGRFIATNASFIFQNSTMSQYLVSRGGTFHDQRVVSAVAHLINAYAAAIGVRIADEATARQYMLRIHGFLNLEIRRLLNSNSGTEVDAALALTTQQVMDATTKFRNALQLPTTGHFFPAPNFFETDAGSIRIQGDEIGATIFTGSLISNDLFAQGTAQGNGGFFPAQSTVTGVTVPAETSASISVSLLDEPTGRGIDVTALGGFRGRTYFDYHVRHPSGQTGSARVYIPFR